MKDIKVVRSLIFAVFFLLFMPWSMAADFDYGPQPFGPYETRGEWRSFEGKIAGQVRYYVATPKGKGQWPGIYYIYGRPGLDHRLFPEIRRIASFGYTVAVVHFQEALLIPILIDTADPAEVIPLQMEGFDAFLKLPERKKGKVCVVATVRGGVYGTIISATRPQDVACFIGLHAVLTDHAEPEPFQEVNLLKEVRQLKAPTLLMVGDSDFEVRLNQNKRLAEYLRERDRPVELVVYPRATRGFDFRVIGRGLADDFAKIDSMNRTIAFVRKHLNGDPRAPELSATAIAPMPLVSRLPTPDERGQEEVASTRQGPVVSR